MEYDIESIIRETREAQKEMRKIIKRVVVVAFLVFLLTVSTAIVLDITVIGVPVVALFGMLYFFPLVTFFLGMAIIWKKKFTTIQQLDENVEP